ncbi:unnamed protein product [Symbiodinium sp. CCMP2592]|nr:unnamed protein product [Symbiodinium sp. CCMP2592]
MAPLQETLLLSLQEDAAIAESKELVSIRTAGIDESKEIEPGNREQSRQSADSSWFGLGSLCTCSSCSTDQEETFAPSKDVEPSYHGHIRDDAASCWISFPGKYASGWEALVKEFHRDSVACVFLCSPEDGLGKHADDPENPGKCYCARIYGERDFRAFGYLSVLKAPYTDDRIKKYWEKAAAMNAVPIRQDATDEEREEATKKAEEQWEKMGRTASWGCAWYKRWFDLVCTAVEKKQRLKAVFFPRQVGEGVPSMEELPQVDLWNGVGCGGSQKSELATANFMRKHFPGWDYEEVDVTRFLKHEFPPGAHVDALHGSRWRKGLVVDQMEKATTTQSGAQSTELYWKIRCDDSREIFEAKEVHHRDLAVETLLDSHGDFLHGALRQCLMDIKILQTDASRLRTGTPALSVRIEMNSIHSLHGLRDRVLSGAFDQSVNEGLAAMAPEYKIKFDKSRFFELYEDSLLGLEKLTYHQQVKLKEMEGLNDVHLSAPAGAGKTFVAVQHALDHLSSHPSARVLYVAPSESLGLHFIRWISMRLASRTRASNGSSFSRLRTSFSSEGSGRESPSEWFRSTLVQGPNLGMHPNDPEPTKTSECKIQELLTRMTLLHHPYKNFQLPSLDDDRIVLSDEPDMQECDLVVFDECHTIFSLPPAEMSRTMLPRLSAPRRLLLSDVSQSASVSQRWSAARNALLQVQPRFS